MPLLRTRYVPFVPSRSRRSKSDLIQNARRSPNCAVPNVVYAKDGRRFFPCTFCCRAFAYKKHQSSHMLACHFRHGSKTAAGNMKRGEKMGRITVAKFATTEGCGDAEGEEVSVEEVGNDDDEQSCDEKIVSQLKEETKPERLPKQEKLESTPPKNKLAMEIMNDFGLTSPERSPTNQSKLRLKQEIKTSPKISAEPVEVQDELDFDGDDIDDPDFDIREARTRVKKRTVKISYPIYGRRSLLVAQQNRRPKERKKTLVIKNYNYLLNGNVVEKLVNKRNTNRKENVDIVEKDPLGEEESGETSVMNGDEIVTNSKENQADGGKKDPNLEEKSKLRNGGTNNNHIILKIKMPTSTIDDEIQVPEMVVIKNAAKSKKRNAERATENSSAPKSKRQKLQASEAVEKPKKRNTKKTNKRTQSPFPKSKQKRDPLECLYCAKMCENAIELLRHKREFHRFPKVHLAPDTLEHYDKIYKETLPDDCPVCKRPVKPLQWPRHLKTHSSEKSYVCRICKRRFNRSDHLQHHESRHIVTEATI